MNFDDFINEWDGKKLDFYPADHEQCVDLADQYAHAVVGKDLPALGASGGAKDFWNLDIPGYEKISNSPTGIPSKGDIVIWGSGVGVSGHIAVFVNGDANNFISFDQNWPIGSVCHKQNHDYNGVLGWFHPQSLNPVETVAVPKADFERLVTKSTDYDQFVAIGFSSASDVQNAVKSYQQTINDKQSQNDILQNIVNHDIEQIKDLNDKLAECQGNHPPQDSIVPHREYKILGVTIWIF